MLEEERGPIQELWEKFDYKYMQPMFLKEMMPQHDNFNGVNDDLLEEEIKEDSTQLSTSNIF